MNLFPELFKRYTQEQYPASEAQRQAEFIAFAPAIFQVSRIMLKWGIVSYLRDNESAFGEIVKEFPQYSPYSLKVLLEASLSIGTVLVDAETGKFRLSKVGWFLLNDPATKVNMDFNHDVNYEGFFRLEESLLEGRPAGLEHFGPWPTIYEGLSSLPKEVQDSWFAFDHFYSDTSFDKALSVIFDRPVENLLDVGGNTGKWALRCVGYDPNVKVTVFDLPQQIALMKKNIEGKVGSERISGIGGNLLDENTLFPSSPSFDVIWMSQFLDCFSESEIVSILKRAASVMGENTRLCIMELLWDRQRYEPAAMCLTLTSVYFAAMANGNSKMYHSEDFCALVEASGLKIDSVTDSVGQGHNILVCKRI